MDQEAQRLSLDIVTPERHLVYEQVDEVNIPGSEGDFGVLPGHTPFLSTLRPGVLSYRKGKVVKYFAVSLGFAEVIPHRVIVLAQTAESAEHISEQRAQRARDRAKERLEDAAKGSEKIDVDRAEFALRRAMARLNALRLHRARR